MKKKDLKAKVAELEKQIAFYEKRSPELKKEYFNWRRLVMEKAEQHAKEVEDCLLFGTFPFFIEKGGL